MCLTESLASDYRCAKTHAGARNLDNKMCEDCGLKQPNFAVPGKRARKAKCGDAKDVARWCAECAKSYPGAANVTKICCEDCHKVQPKYGLPSEGRRARWCKQCSLQHPGSRDVRNNKCEDCQLKQPNYGFKNEGRKPRWCSHCAKAHVGATDVLNKMCEDCGLKQPNFGIQAEGRKPRWCVGCSKQHDGAVDTVSKRCEECLRPGTRPRWGMPGDTSRQRRKWCESCAKAKHPEAGNLSLRKDAQNGGGPQKRARRASPPEPDARTELTNHWDVPVGAPVSPTAPPTDAVRETEASIHNPPVPLPQNHTNPLLAGTASTSAAALFSGRAAVTAAAAHVRTTPTAIAAPTPGPGSPMAPPESPVPLGRPAPETVETLADDDDAPIGMAPPDSPTAADAHAAAAVAAVAAQAHAAAQEQAGPQSLHAAANAQAQAAALRAVSDLQTAVSDLAQTQAASLTMVQVQVQAQHHAHGPTEPQPPDSWAAERPTEAAEAATAAEWPRHCVNIGE